MLLIFFYVCMQIIMQHVMSLKFDPGNGYHFNSETSPEMVLLSIMYK